MSQAIHSLYAANDQLVGGPPPAHQGENWQAAARHKASGFASYQFLFCDNLGVLYGVVSGRLYKGFPDKWEEKTCVGRAGWDLFTKLFFDGDGVLYAVNRRGQLLRGVPPLSADDNWIRRAHLVGNSGWNNFQFLFFHPTDGNLYGVINGKFHKAPPPQSESDNWSSRATCIGNAGWDHFKHLFFHPDGINLYGAHQSGKLIAAPPPQYPHDNWESRAELKGRSGWKDFQYLFACRCDY